MSRLKSDAKYEIKGVENEVGEVRRALENMEVEISKMLA